MENNTPAKGALIARGRTAEVYAWQENQVLKLFYDWCQPSWVEHEIEIGRQLAGAPLPTPRMLGALTVDGRPGIIYERVEGPTMLRRMAARPWQIPRLARQLAELHSRVHQQSGAGFASLRASLRRTIAQVDSLPADQKDAIAARLDRLPDGAALCHFDFHPDQVMLTPHGPMILDWMTAMQGDPLADVARTQILLSFGQAPGASWFLSLLLNLARRAFFRAYLGRYLELNPAASLDQLRAWLLPVAAARLDEKIPGEQAGILKLIGELLRSSR